MGIGPFRHSSSYSYSEPPKVSTTPNPNPFRFEVIRSLEVGRYLICQVRYPDCTTFEGIKVMVFDGLSKGELLKLKKLDPHFFEDAKAPIARFRGNKKGWAYALLFVSSLAMEE